MTSPPIKKRLLIVSSGLNRGGAERQILRLVGSIRAQFDILVASLVSGGALIPDFRGLGVNVVELEMTAGLSSASNLRGYFKLLSLARAFNPDVIHGWQFDGNFAAMLIGNMLRRPVVTSKRGSNVVYGKKRLFAERLTYRKSNRVLTNSRALADEVAALGSSKSIIRVIPNGIDLQDYAESTFIRDLSKEPGRIVIGTVGRFVREKRYEDLLESAERLLAEFPELSFLWVGGRGYFERIQAQIRERGLEDRIELTGEVQDVRPWLARMDIFTLVSSQEGMPNAIMEAMALAKPVIATGVGGIPDLVTDGKTGFLVSALNVDEITEATRKLILNPDLRDELGANGRQAIESFSVEAMCQRMCELYSELT